MSKKIRLTARFNYSVCRSPLDGVDCETLTAALSVEAGINNNYQKDTVMNAHSVMRL